MAAWEDAPYVKWLEDIVREMVEIEPESIAMEMIGADDKTYTCYWETSADDRARMISAMQDDDRMEWVRENREAIKEILGEDGEEGGEGE